MTSTSPYRRQDLTSRLRDYLGELSPESHRTLIRSIDRARARGEITAVHAIIMDALRDVTDSGARVERTMSAERAFFEHLEPIMRPLPLPEKQVGIIDRASLRPIWIWITRDLAPGRCDGSLAALRAAVVDEDERAIAEFSDEFQRDVCRHATALMEELDKKHGSLQRLEGQLGSSRVLADLHDIIAFFDQKKTMEAFLEALPDRLPVGQEGLKVLSDALGIYSERPPSDSVYPFAAIHDRLGSPSDLVRFAIQYAETTHPAIIRGTHAAGAVQIALSEAMLDVEHLRLALEGERNLANVTRVLRSYHDRVWAISRSLDEAPGDPWLKRLATIRSLASDLLTKELEPLLFMVKRTIGIVENRGREIVPDQSSINEAIFAMTLLIAARETKGSLAINSLIEQLEKGIEDALESQGKSAIDRLAAASDETWEAAHARSEAAVKLFGIYYGGTYGASMSRRHQAVVDERNKKMAS